MSGIMASNVSECFLGPDRDFELSRSSWHLLVTWDWLTAAEAGQQYQPCKPPNTGHISHVRHPSGLKKMVTETFCQSNKHTDWHSFAAKPPEIHGNVFRDRHICKLKNRGWNEPPNINHIVADQLCQTTLNRHCAHLLFTPPPPHLLPQGCKPSCNI